MSRMSKTSPTLPAISLAPFTADDIYDRLATVIDPELGINIVKLGLIYKVEVQGKAETQESPAAVKKNSSVVQTGQNTAQQKTAQPFVRILMTLTTPGCPLAGTFDQMVRDSLYGLPGVDVDQDVRIDLTFDPPWVPDMMDEEAKAELGF